MNKEVCASIFNLFKQTSGTPNDPQLILHRAVSPLSLSGTTTVAVFDFFYHEDTA